MIGRRELFKLMGGASVAAATVRPSDLIAAASKGGAVVGPVGADHIADPIATDGYSNSVWQLFDDLHARASFSRSDPQHMDLDIRSKKSWSPAYKSIIHSQREREMYDLRRKMQNDEAFAAKIKKLLGGAQ